MLVPPLATLERAGMAEGLTAVKRRKVRGFSCISAVYRNSNVDYRLFCSKSRGVFVYVLARVGLLAVGHLRAWAEIGLDFCGK